MTAGLKDLLTRAERWPKEAQQALVEVGEQIELELAGQPYDASPDELAAIDEALGQADRGEFASEEDWEAARAKLRR